MPRQTDQELMAECVARVLGGEKASAVSKDAQVPYSTLMRYVGRRRPSGAPSPSHTPSSRPAAAESSDSASMPYTLEAEQLVFEWMKREQAAGRRLNRQLVLAKAVEALGWRHGATDALSAWWFRRFRHRRPEVVGPASKLSVVLDASARAGRAPGSDDSGVNESAERRPPSDELCAACAASGVALDAVERAVRQLQAEYVHKLEPAEMAAAFDVALDPLRARGFASMAPGVARDLWLYKQIRQRRAEDDE